MWVPPVRRRSVGITTRIAALTVAAMIAVAALAVLVWLQGGATRSGLGDVSDLAEIRAAAQTAQYDLADLNGWQTAYALDVALGGPASALDSSHSRRSFLDTAARTRTRLDTLQQLAAAFPADHADELTAAAADFEKFMSIDDEVVSKYRTGQPVDKRLADKLVLEDEIAVFADASNRLRAFVGAVAAREAGVSAAARRTAHEGQVVSAGAAVVVVFGLGAGTWVVAMSVRRRLGALTLRLTEIAQGNADLTARLDESGGDEISCVGVLFNTFAGQVADLVRQVASSSAAIAAATEQLSATSAVVADAADRTSDRAAHIVGAADEVDDAVSSVSTAAGELSESIAEIARNTTLAARVAAQAVEVAHRATTTVQALGTASAEISAVVSVIDSVAAQTNLLALNATIEAARAGEAGKGFAVVANEVKDLAHETARATSDISRRIDHMQAQTTAAVTAISEIGAVITQINDFQASIAGAVEQQTATTSELSRAVTVPRQGVGRISWV